MTAVDGMNQALLELLEQGTRPPCGYGVGTDDHPWFAETTEGKAYAARLCRHCPITAECAALADELRPTFGIWAGTDWSNVKRKRGAA